MGPFGLGSVAAMGLLALPGAEAKGQAWGYRTVGSRAMPSTRTGSYYGGSSFGYYPVYYGGGWHGTRSYYSTSNGRQYSPDYGNWDAAAGFTGIDEGENATCGACPCPRPNEALTKRWVWVQMITAAPMCALCGGSNPGMPAVNGTDTVTFEVDAFMEIASRIACLPPTTVLALKLCVLSKWSDVDGGLADDQLNDKKKCFTVGANSQTLPGARRLLGTPPTGLPPYFVVQFVVGATSEGHGKFMEPYIKDALNNPASRLKSLYNITRVFSVETETPLDTTVGAVIGFILLGCCACCILCACAAMMEECLAGCCDCVGEVCTAFCVGILCCGICRERSRGAAQWAPQENHGVDEPEWGGHSLEESRYTAPPARTATPPSPHILEPPQGLGRGLGGSRSSLILAPGASSSWGPGGVTGAATSTPPVAPFASNAWVGGDTSGGGPVNPYAMPEPAGTL